MDCFFGIVDLVPFIMEEMACIQFTFDEGLLNTRMVCSECHARLSPKNYGSTKYPLFLCQRGNKKITVCKSLTVNNLMHFIDMG